MAAWLTAFSLGPRYAPVKSYQRTGERDVQNCTQTLLLRCEAAQDISREELFSQMCYRPFAREFRGFTHLLLHSSSAGSRGKMAERPVLVGLVPQVVVLDPGDQISWISDAGNLRVEFDVNRCPFSSNIFQAPAGMRLLSGPPRVGLKSATYKYRLWLNDQLVGQGEVILREK
jgi:hypothetical protein